MFTKKFKYILIIAILSMAVSIIFGANTSPQVVHSMGHEFVVIEVIPPTCREDGRNILQCIRCGMVAEQILYAPGCNWLPWVVEREATCTVAGLRRSSCRDCNRSQTEAINVREHNLEREEEEASCLESGMIAYVCSECGYVDREYSEDPTGHTYVEYVIKEPSCLEPGLIEIGCEICDYHRIEDFGEPTGHDFIEVIISEGVCGEAGVRSFVCVLCDYSYEEIIPELTHSWGEWVVEVPPEEGVDGIRHKICIYCDERISEMIPALEVLAEPEQPLFGVEEVVVGGANVAALYLLYLLLFGEVSAILWYRKRKKEILARNEENQKKEKEMFGEVV